MSVYSLGIDPGWKNLGIALLEIDAYSKVSVVRSAVLNPSESKEKYGSRWAFCKELDTWLAGCPVHYTGMERYVSYKGVDASESENILMTMGMLGPWLLDAGADPFLYRAFDWKKELCQYLVKEKGFSNPSTSFDKKYSIAAAKACLDYPHTFGTDHEADAVAIAFTNFIHKEK